MAEVVTDENVKRRFVRIPAFGEYIEISQFLLGIEGGRQIALLGVHFVSFRGLLSPAAQRQWNDAASQGQRINTPGVFICKCLEQIFSIFERIFRL